MPRFSVQSNGRVPAPAWVTPSGAGFVVLTPLQISRLTPDQRLKYAEDLRRSQFRELTPEQILALTPAQRAQYGADRLFALGDTAQAAEKQRLVNPAEAFIPVAQNAIGATRDVLLAAINGADLNEREAIRARTEIRLAELRANNGDPNTISALSQTSYLLGQQPPIGPYYGQQPVDNKNLYIAAGVVAVAAVGGYLYMNSQRRSNPVVRVGKRRSKKFIPAAKLRRLRARKSRSRSRSRSR